MIKNHRGEANLSRQKVLVSPIKYTAVFGLFLILSCFSTAFSLDYQGPPRDLVEDNLRRSEMAAEVVVDDVKTGRIFPSDSGKGGYVRCMVSGVIARVIKGRLSKAQRISYSFTVEYDKTPVCPVREGGNYIVFLKKDQKTGELWLLGEGAQFKSSSELLQILEDIAGSR